MSRCQEFLEHLNSVEPSIQFTLEKESEGKLPFLDVHLEHHRDGSVSTSVYRKPTHTNKYLDFTSHHPLAHKTAVVCTLKHRAGALSSTFEAQEKERECVMSALLENGYPRRFIHQSVSTPSRPPHEAIADCSGNPKATVCLPYVCGVSEQLKRVLRNVQIRTVMRPHRTLRQRLVHLKDALPDMERSNVVYHIPCAECPCSHLCRRDQEKTV